MQDTIVKLLEHGRAHAPAILAPDNESLTYGKLREHVTRVVAKLNSWGFGRNDRVAIVLPNGPHMAPAFVSVAAGAIAAPLNPSYPSEEFSFFLQDLDASALILMAN